MEPLCTKPQQPQSAGEFITLKTSDGALFNADKNILKAQSGTIQNLLEDISEPTAPLEIPIDHATFKQLYALMENASGQDLSTRAEKDTLAQLAKTITLPPAHAASLLNEAHYLAVKPLVSNSIYTKLAQLIHDKKITRNNLNIIAQACGRFWVSTFLPGIAQYYYLQFRNYDPLREHYNIDILNNNVEAWFWKKIPFGVSIKQMREYDTTLASFKKATLTATRFDLSNSNITNIDGLADVPGITEVSAIVLADNFITEISPGTFNGLPKLRYLYLNHNQLSTLAANTFNGLTNLQTLYLNHNQLSILAPGTFNGLTNLETLHLNHNQLSTLAANIFNVLTNLQILYLNHNQLSTLAAGTFNGLTNLETLKLIHNQLTPESAQEIQAWGRNKIPPCTVHIRT